MELLAKLCSWWHGVRIGSLRYVKASPFILGNISHCLPEELWTDTERNSLRYCCYRHRWNGFGWVADGYVEFNRDEMKQALLEQENGRS
jgi:hypothetical protein